MTDHKPTGTVRGSRRWALWLGAALVLLLTACVPPPKDRDGPPPPPPARQIGTLRVIAGSVTLNGRPARDRMPVYDGNKVATGGGSSAIVDFVTGGNVQLNVNTDPYFFWRATCILIKILSGEALVDATNVCVETPDGEFTTSSRVNVEVRGGQVTITVLQGSVRILGMARPIGEREQVILKKAQIVDQRKLDPARLRVVPQWTEKFKVAPGPHLR